MATLDKNYQYCNDALSLKTTIEQSFIKLGEYLYNIREKELYKPSWTSWREFYTELKMSSNMADKLIQIYETFVVQYAIPEEKIVTAGGWSTIQEILPVIANKKDAEHWLETAAVLSRNDLRKEVKEVKTNLSEKNCKHKNTYTITVCRDCGIKMEDHKDHK